MAKIQDNLSNNKFIWQNNRSKLAESYSAESIKSAGYPAHLKIELTNYCNLECPVCPRQYMKRPVGYMHIDLFRKIILDAKSYLEFIYLHHLGESLFHPQIGKFISIARENGIHAGLSTNATLLDEDKIADILSNGLDFLVVSLDAATEIEYVKHRIGADFSKTFLNVTKLFDLKKKMGSKINIVIQLIQTTHSAKEISLFLQQWKSSAMIKVARDWAGQIKTQNTKHRAIESKPCKMLWSELTILWDGHVVPCANVVDKVNVLGDLNSKSLSEIWNDDPIKELRSRHLSNDLSLIPCCSMCDGHSLNEKTYIEQSQFEARLNNYICNDDSPRSGLS
ncbi:MAG: SPASM domain-containing protein [Fibrobacteres bacterium]|nr:SPASM domain-containing protein [Fibrobacterota bacterium]